MFTTDQSRRHGNSQTMIQAVFLLLLCLGLSAAFNQIGRARVGGIRMDNVDKILTSLERNKILTKTAQLGLLSKLDKARALVGVEIIPGQQPSSPLSSAAPAPSRACRLSPSKCGATGVGRPPLRRPQDRPAPPP